METKIKESLVKLLNSFFNEIDLVFDYVPKPIVKNLMTFLKELENPESLKNFINKTTITLKPFSESLYKYNGKVKNSDLDFLNNIILFDDLLNFSVFTNENKNTKKSIVKYLYNIYISVNILNVNLEMDQDLKDQIQEFIKRGNKQNKQNKENDLTDLTDLTNLVVDQKNILKNPKIPNPNIFESLLQNKQLMSLANDLSSHIQEQNIDPMAIISSMMSGKMDSNVSNLILNMTNKIESKINSGEIDQAQLEKQATELMSNFGDIPGFTPPKN